MKATLARALIGIIVILALNTHVKTGPYERHVNLWETLGMISFRQLEIFRAVMVTGSISGAAQLLGIAQPTVTNAVKRFEDILGVVLFERVGVGVRPTSTAHQIFQVAGPSVTAFEQLTETVMQVAQGQQATFSMGVSPSVSQALAPRALSIFRAKRPGTTLRMDTLSMSQIRDYLWLAEGNCAVTIFPVDEPGLSAFRISSVGVVCVVPETHRLAQKDRIDVTDMSDEPLVFFHRNTPHGRLMRQVFDAAGVKPKIAIETRFAETAVALMEEGFGIALQDELTGLGVRKPGLKVMPILGTARQPVLVHCRSDSAAEPSFAVALECLVAAVRDLGLPDEYRPGASTGS